MTGDRITLSTQYRLESWKAIASFLGRDESTVRRWEKSRLLPVHRALGDHGPVFAYKSELLLWLHPPTTPETAHVPGSGFHMRSSSPAVHGALGRGRAGNPGRVEAPSPKAAALHSVSGRGSQGDILSRRPRGRWLFWAAASAFALFLFAADSYYARLMAAPAGTPVPPLRRTPIRARPDAPAALPIPPALHELSRSDHQQAQELYLRGRYDWNRRTRQSLDRSLDNFTQAIVHDPNYAQAYAGLAATYALMPQYCGMAPREAYPRAIDAARRAVALAPALPEAHRVLGFALFYWEWDVPGAFAEFHRAIELDPNDAEAHHWYATSLLTLRRFEQARAEMERARELDPGSRAIAADGALIEATAGAAGGADLDRSLARLHELQRMEPDFESPTRYVNEMLLEHDRFGEWVLGVKRSALRFHSSDRALARAAERGWKNHSATALFEELRRTQEKTFDDGESSGYDLALVCLRLGDKEAAVRYLEAAAKAHDFRLLSLVHDPADAKLRGFRPYEDLRHAVESRANSPA